MSSKSPTETRETKPEDRKALHMLAGLDFASHFAILLELLVRRRGLEPLCLAALAPQAMSIGISGLRGVSNQ
jgi:hypothetical protein